MACWKAAKWTCGFVRSYWGGDMVLDGPTEATPLKRISLFKVKAEDDFPCSQDDVLDPSWNQPSPPDKMLHYPKFSSPGGCSDFD